MMVVRKLILIFIISLTFLFIIGCAGNPIRRGGEAARNRSNLAKLNLGMTKDEVVNLMGRPAKTEAYEIQGTNLEFWHYRTEYNWQLGTLEDTALVFEGGVLKGWGLGNYYDQTLVKPESKMERTLLDLILVLPPYHS
jgi:hypothetical protein